jgi:hypothetical protein
MAKAKAGSSSSTKISFNKKKVSGKHRKSRNKHDRTEKIIEDKVVNFTHKLTKIKIMKFLSSIYDGIKGLFTDEHGVVSSKRFVGILCATTLCVTMYHNSFSTVDVAPAPYLVDAVALLALGCLG